MHGSRMLLFPLLSLLTQLHAVMTPIEVFHRHLQSTLLILQQGLGVLDWNANKVLRMSHEKMEVKTISDAQLSATLWHWGKSRCRWWMTW